MCGIAGIFESKSQAPIDRALLRRMTDSLGHRGPDDSGYFDAPGVGLGHRRLSIIDVAGGHQPLFNEDGSVVIVYNGEIYNFQSLAMELTAAGHSFRTHSDTEVVVHAWEEWGERCVERFRGMFAFALWDTKRETLFLARDRLGIKPLYYAMLGNGTLLFGSELKALLQHPDLSRRIGVEAVEDYFAYGYIPDPKTIYQDVAKLGPGHVLSLRRGQELAAPRPYWDITFNAPRHAMSADDMAEELVAQLRDAVRLRLISEVPLGAFLSGGVDSSAIVALMAELSEGPVNTCSIGFNQAGFDETRYASQIAERYATRHRSETVDADAFDLVDRLAGMYDEPFADSSAIPTMALGAFLSGGVDSSAIVALMAGLSDGPVNTCSIGFNQAGFDETQDMVQDRHPNLQGIGHAGPVHLGQDIARQIGFEIRVLDTLHVIVGGRLVHDPAHGLARPVTLKVGDEPG